MRNLDAAFSTRRDWRSFSRWPIQLKLSHRGIDLPGRETEGGHLTVSFLSLEYSHPYQIGTGHC